MKNETKFFSGFAAIVGRPNVGKSTMMNAMVGEKVAIVSNRPQTTRNRIMGVVTDKDWQIVFLDTPGLHKPRTRLGEYMVKTVQDAMDGIDVLLVLVDANEIGAQDRAIVEEMSGRKVKKILVLNKTDIVEEARLMVIGRKGFMPVEGTGKSAPAGTSIFRIPLVRGEEPILRNYCAFWKKDNTVRYVKEFADILQAQFE